MDDELELKRYAIESDWHERLRREYAFRQTRVQMDGLPALERVCRYGFITCFSKLFANLLVIIPQKDVSDIYLEVDHREPQSNTRELLHFEIPAVRVLKTIRRLVPLLEYQCCVERKIVSMVITLPP